MRNARDGAPDDVRALVLRLLLGRLRRSQEDDHRGEAERRSGLVSGQRRKLFKLVFSRLVKMRVLQLNNVDDRGCN